MATHAHPLAGPTMEADLASRRAAVDSALGTTLAEGVSPTPEALALFESYARGSISLDDLLPSIKALQGI